MEARKYSFIGSCPTWICGPGRSGTTYLYKLLPAHPSIHAIHGREFSGLVYDHLETSMWFPRRDSVRQQILNAPVLSRRHCIEKTPDHIFFVDKIYEYLPMSKFILTIRHPLCIIESLCRKFPRRYPSIKRALETATQSIGATIDVYQKYSNIVLLIPHENILLDQYEMVRQLLEFICVEHGDDTIDSMCTQWPVRDLNNNHAESMLRLTRDDQDILRQNLPALIGNINSVLGRSYALPDINNE